MFTINEWRAQVIGCLVCILVSSLAESQEISSSLDPISQAIINTNPPNWKEIAGKLFKAQSLEHSLTKVDAAALARQFSAADNGGSPAKSFVAALFCGRLFFPGQMPLPDTEFYRLAEPLFSRAIIESVITNETAQRRYLQYFIWSDIASLRGGLILPASRMNRLAYYHVSVDELETFINNIRNAIMRNNGFRSITPANELEYWWCLKSVLALGLLTESKWLVASIRDVLDQKVAIDFAFERWRDEYFGRQAFYVAKSGGQGFEYSPFKRICFAFGSSVGRIQKFEFYLAACELTVFLNQSPYGILHRPEFPFVDWKYTSPNGLFESGFLGTETPARR
ncbi:MAG: hypothetical protein ACK493_10110 [Planctomycetota bacterium]|jgi:hypothetical protein